MKKLGLVTLLAALTFIVISTIVQAQWSALSSGYAITTNWHGMDVPIGESVTAWAGTTDDTVGTVEFIWKDPDGNVVRGPIFQSLTSYTTPMVPLDAPQEIVDWANNNPGIAVWYATDEYTPGVIGDWAVKATFINDDGQTASSENDSFPVKATSFFAIPEVQFGTLAILLTMLASLAIFARKRKL